MAKTFAELITEDQRLVLLRALAEQAQYKANSSVLATAMSYWGHEITRDRVKTELRWLEEQRLVRIEELADGSILLAILTSRGQDVAAGRAHVDGIARPGPK